MSDWPVLKSSADPGAEVFKRNAETNERLAAELLERLSAAGLGGPERARAIEVTRPDEWWGLVLDHFGLSYEDLTADERAFLWQRTLDQHRAWRAATGE